MRKLQRMESLGMLAGGAWFASAPDEFGLVLLDIEMPGMNGNETFTALTNFQPGIRVIVWTGFAVEEHCHST